MADLHLRYRPKKLEDLVGQDRAVKQLKGYLNSGRFPKALALTGPAGCGKTTTARVLRRLLKCHKDDCAVYNMARDGGVDTVREITDQRMNLSCLNDARVFILEEAHKTTEAGQQALLLATEEPPAHVHFILCTTDYHKMLPTVRSRFKEVRFSPLADAELAALLEGICAEEGKEIDADVLNRIVENSDGSPRRALVHLGGVLCLKSKREQLDSILPDATRAVAADLFRLLLWRRASWGELLDVLNRANGEEPEALRRIVLAVAANELLRPNGNHRRAADVIEALRCNTFDGGRAELAVMLYRLVPEKPAKK